MRQKIDISIERVPHNGHLLLSAIVDNQLIRRTYIGHTKREAMVQFRAELKKGRKAYQKGE